MNDESKIRRATGPEAALLRKFIHAAAGKNAGEIIAASLMMIMDVYRNRPPGTPPASEFIASITETLRMNLEEKQ